MARERGTEAEEQAVQQAVEEVVVAAISGNAGRVHGGSSSRDSRSSAGDGLGYDRANDYGGAYI